MAAGDQTKASAKSASALDRQGEVGTYVAYARSDGREIWRKEGFVRHRDQVPMGVSITMGAGVLLDPRTGESIFKWNPWGILPG